MRHLRALFLVFAVLCGLCASTLALSPRAAAVDVLQSCSNATAATTDYCKTANAEKVANKNPAIGVIKAIIGILSIVGGAAAVVGIIISAIRLIIANGDANSITAARNGILYSVIGITVIVFAQIIVVFVLNKVK